MPGAAHLPAVAHVRVQRREYHAFPCPQCRENTSKSPIRVWHSHSHLMNSRCCYVRHFWHLLCVPIGDGRNEASAEGYKIQQMNRDVSTGVKENFVLVYRCRRARAPSTLPFITPPGGKVEGEFALSIEKRREEHVDPKISPSIPHSGPAAPHRLFVLQGSSGGGRGSRGSPLDPLRSSHGDP